ncbi:MAG: phosphatase PAP2 family protein [Actinomycetota bacterium]
MTDDAMLRNHRRALLWSLLLLVVGVGALFLVGRHPPELRPLTTLPAIGRFDASMLTWMDDIRTQPVTWLARLLSIIGAGVVTIPLRALATVVLLVRRQYRRASAFILTWITAEVLIVVLKNWFHRGRPPGGLVETIGYSFPSGHAIASSATAVALVLAFFPPGDRRRRWEWIAIGFSFVMAFSRVYLAAHWFSDVVVGTLLGSGIAIFWAAAVTEMRDVVFRSEGKPIPPDAAEAEPGELLQT